MKSKFILSFALAAAIFSSMLCGFGNDTAYAEEYTRNEVFNMDDTARMRGAKFITQTKHARFGFDHSIGWVPESTEYCEYWMNGWQDWTDYAGAVVTMYSEKATNKSVFFRWYSRGSYNAKTFYVSWKGWNTMYIPFGSGPRDSVEYIRIGQTNKNDGVMGTELTFSSVRLVKKGEYDFYDSAFGYEVADRTRAELGGSTAVYGGSEYCIVDGTRSLLGKNGEKAIFENGTVMVPKSFIKTLGYKSKTEYTTEKDIDGTAYVSFAEAAELDGQTVLTSEKLAVASRDEDLTVFKTAEDEPPYPTDESKNKLNPYGACAAQLIRMGEIGKAEASADDFAKITSGIKNDLAERNASTADLDKEAETQLELINRNKQNPFEDITGKTARDTAECYARIEKLAAAYSTETSKYCKSDDVKTAVINSLEYMYNNRFGKKQLDGSGVSYADDEYRNVYIPQSLANTLIMMGDDITAEDCKKYLSYYTKNGINFVSDEELVPDSIRAIAAVGALTENSDMLAYASGKLAEQFLYADDEKLQDTTSYLLMDSLHYQYKERRIVEMPKFVRSRTKYLSGQGILSDGSYISGGAHGENGSDGLMLTELIETAKLFEDTPFKQDKSTGERIFEVIENGYYPFVYNGKMARAVTGNDGENLAEKGKTVLGAMLDALDIVPDEYEPKLKGMIKSVYAQYGSAESLGFNAERTELLKKVTEDSAVTAEKSVSNNIYPRMDKMVQRGENFSMTLSMSSKRIFDYDSTECKNLTGWYQGSGMTAVYAEGDSDGFGDEYWSSADPYRLPGTTVMLTDRAKSSVRSGLEYQSSSEFVGGVSDGENGVAAMTVSPYIVKDIIGSGSVGTAEAEGELPPMTIDLSAKKAWFTFDKEIVALGCGITVTGSDEVITTVDNRAGVASVTGGTNWKHYSGSGEYGYYFPQGGNISETEENGYRTLWFAHGLNPKNSTYAYVILPGMNGAETQEYANAPDTEILSNTDKVQAVKNNRSGIKSYVFYDECEFDGIAVSEPVAVMIESEGDSLKLYISDPSQTLKTAKITISGKYAVTRSDIVTAATKAGKTELTVNFGGSRGKTLVTELKKN